MIRACVLAALLATTPAQRLLAAPVVYDLQAEASDVTFETDFGAQVIRGAIPIAAADLVLDLDQLANCRIVVTLNAAGADASFPFAAEALKGMSVLDTAHHPRIRFVSRSVTAAGDGAQVTGDLTIRGVTRPVTLRAEIFRQKGTLAGDRSRLTVRLTGSLQRAEFGATGFAAQVGDEVRIIITARIIRQE